MSSGKRPYRQTARAEARSETRRRIAAATAALHEEVGPLRTTVVEIARRAGVQRATVYANFPEERDLFAACQGHFLSANPPPDPGPALALGEEERVRAVLAGLYGWYRRTRRMSGNVRRDRAALPALDALLADSVDARMARLADALAPEGGERRALVALALDFWTWHRLDAEGLSDAQAARVMAEAVRTAAPPR